MLALVIGGNGFIGSCLVERLRAGGHSVRVLDVSRARDDFDWRGVDYVVGNLLDSDALPSIIDGVEVVFHLASSTVPSTSNIDPVADVQSNLVGALRLCAAMIASNTRRIVYLSSGGTVYGEPEQLPVPESHPLRPISSYGVVKVAIENYLMMHSHLGSLDPLILRPSNPYGPRQSTAGIQGVIATFLGKALRGEGVCIWGDGEVVRDYLFIDDLVEFVAEAGFGNRTGIVNVGSGQGHTLNQILRMVREASGAALPVEYAPKRGYDVAEIVLDITRATTDFNWRPEVSLAVGIRRTWLAQKARQALT